MNTKVCLHSKVAASGSGLSIWNWQAGLESYLNYIQSIPLLSAEEEYDLASRLHDAGDLDAAHRLVISHMRYVVSVAKKYSGYGLAMADLIQEGSVGLMKAVKRFVPDRQVRLVTFAMHWIKAEIQEFIIKNWRLVKIATTKAQRKLFFKLRSLKSSQSALSQDEILTISDDLGVRPQDVKVMEQRFMAGSELSLSLPTDDEEATEYHPGYNLPAPAITEPEQQLLLAEKQVQLEQLNLAINNLPVRTKEIVIDRIKNKHTLADLASKHGISKERVRQIANQGYEQLKNLLLAKLAPNSIN